MDRVQAAAANPGVSPLLAASVALLVTVAAGGAWAAGAQEAPDAAKGKTIAAEVCAPCHNADGNSVISVNPKLAGQNATYLVKQLTDLVKPTTDKTARENPVMSGIASTLSPADRQNVAAWFSSQAPWAAASVADKDAARMGQRLYQAGLPEKAVPACAGCHGPAGDGLPVLYPRIGGQHSDYVEAQLRAFRDGSRHNNEAMGQIAFRLSDPEIKALADFVGALRAP
jgi:cytochrome c553